MIEAFSVNLVKQVCGCRSLNMSKSVGCRAGCFSAPRSSSSSSAERRAARAEKAAYDVITNNELISLSSLRVVSDIYVCHYCPSTDLPQTDFSVNVLAQSFISFVLIFNLCVGASNAKIDDNAHHPHQSQEPLHHHHGNTTNQSPGPLFVSETPSRRPEYAYSKPSKLCIQEDSRRIQS